MSNSLELDILSIRRQFSRRVFRILKSDFLMHIVEERLLSRLSRNPQTKPNWILDLGCGPGKNLGFLRNLYPKSNFFGIDHSLCMIKTAELKHRPSIPWKWLQYRFSKKPKFAVADASVLPFSAGSVDVVWSNLLAHWIPNLGAALTDWNRVLAPGGSLHFSFFSSGSLMSLREIGTQFMRFPDIQEVGDFLCNLGFTSPVLDSDWFNLTWKNADMLLRDLHLLGGNALKTRRKSLSTVSQYKKWCQELESLRGEDGLLSLKFEVVFVYGQKSKSEEVWKPVNFIR